MPVEPYKKPDFQQLYGLGPDEKLEGLVRRDDFLTPEARDSHEEFLNLSLLRMTPPASRPDALELTEKLLLSAEVVSVRQEIAKDPVTGQVLPSTIAIITRRTWKSWGLNGWLNNLI